MSFRNVVVSAPIFGGWSTQINIDNMSSCTDIVDYTKAALAAWIKAATRGRPNFYGLSESFARESMGYCVHHTTWEEILEKPFDTVYVCWCDAL